MQRLLLALIAPFALSACATTQDAVPLVDSSSAAPFGQGMVSAADPRAVEAGAEMLRRGGSATDAAIATMLALTVVEPQSSGIGGGGFYMRGTLEGEIETLDGRETAPAAAGPQWFLDEAGKPLPFREAVMSGLSVGVPGNLALAAEAHRRHGKLAWAELFEPAVTLAHDGWRLTERFNTFLQQRRDVAGYDPKAQALFFDSAGEPVAVGTLVRNPDLADTLEMIAQQGVASFYKGPFAKGLAREIAAETPRTAGMTAADLAEYSAKERPPVCGFYRAYRVCGMGPPSSGATTVIAILGQLEHFDLSALSPDMPVFWHLFAESQRLAYADRALYLADSDFVSVPVAGLIDPDYLAQRGSLISAEGAMTQVTAGTPKGAAVMQAPGIAPEESGTSHFVAIDREGNAVSYTSTIEGAFGSGIFVGGFYLNNELTDFSFVPAEEGRPVVNRVEGGKRPRSSMAPTLVYGPDGRLALAVGAAGGGTIPVQVARVLIGYIDWHMSIEEALELPVLYSPEDTLIIEAGTALEAMTPALEALGHAEIVVRRLPIKTNAIAVQGSTLEGAADLRSEGVAVAE